MKKLLVLLMIASFVGAVTVSGLMAQEIKFPKPSPKASVFQEVGLAEITITYHSPGVKNREIWGKLVPYDKVWRTGANNATIIKFSDDVMVEGQPLKAGTYGLFTIPGKEKWIMIFSKQTDVWGTYGYKEEQDALRVTVKPRTVPHGMERLLFRFSNVTDNAAKVHLEWDKVSVGFTIKLETQKKVMESIKKSMARYWVAPYQSANYALKCEMLEEAKKLANLSVSINPTYFNTLLKAKVYKKLAKTKKEHKGALKILQQAILLGKKLPERQQGYAKEAQKLLTEWTAKK